MQAGGTLFGRACLRSSFTAYGESLFFYSPMYTRCKDDLSAFGSSLAFGHLCHCFSGKDPDVDTDVKSQLPIFLCLKRSKLVYLLFYEKQQGRALTVKQIDLLASLSSC